MIKQSIAIFALTLAVSSVALADGWGAPAPEVVQRDVVVVQEQPPVNVVVPAVPVAVAASTARNNGALFLGTIGIPAHEANGLDGFLENYTDPHTQYDSVGYLNYSPMRSGVSPVVGVIFGDLKGFNLGAGVGLGNNLKLSLGLNAHNPDEYLTSDMEIGAFTSLALSLPVAGLAAEVGVATPEADQIGSGADLYPTLGLGFRW